MRMLHTAFLIALLSPLVASGVTVNWHPSVSPGVLGYQVYWGTASRAYEWVMDVGDVVSYPLPPLEVGQTYYAAVTAYNEYGESPYSNEVSWVEGEPLPPPAPDVTPPTVTIISPQDGATVPRKAWVTIQVEASDNEAVSHVTVGVNGQDLCLVSEVPYICRWKVPAAKRSYTLDAVAEDEAGNVSEASVVTVTAR